MGHAHIDWSHESRHDPVKQVFLIPRRLLNAMRGSRANRNMPGPAPNLHHGPCRSAKMVRPGDALTHSAAKRTSHMRAAGRTWQDHLGTNEKPKAVLGHSRVETSASLVVTSALLVVTSASLVETRGINGGIKPP